MARINWIPGWASCFSIWKDEIESLFPDHEHIFWNYDELKIFEDTELLDSITMKFRDDIFIAWSLGTQLIFEAHASFAHIKKIICLAPVFEFCNSEFGWKPQILDRMIKKLGSNSEAVIKQFATNMGDNVATPQWIEYASNQNIEDLIWGLEKLKYGNIAHLDDLSGNLHCIFGKNDTIVSSKLVNSFTERFNFITFTCHDNMNHWPLCTESKIQLQQIVNE